jgi:type I restriction enzyme M protein
MYQHLMAYWSETMQDDMYILVSDGWQAGREIEKQEKKKEWAGRLIPKELIIARYFAAGQAAIEKFEAGRDEFIRQMEELAEEHGVEEGLMADAKNDKDKITKASVQKRLKELTIADTEEIKILQDYLKLAAQETEANQQIKAAQDILEKKILDKYKSLTETEVKTLIVADKWLAILESDVKTEMERISQRLTGRIRELAERYTTPMPRMNCEVAALEQKVHTHLNKMGFVWK